jgi:hypothetical protein
MTNASEPALGLPDWPQTIHCRSGRHCRACRDAGGVGAAFRRAVNLPDSFTCPRGWPVGYVPPAPPRPAQPPGQPPSADHAVIDFDTSACAECDYRPCPNVTTCCGGQRTVTIIAPCPLR